jgi:hypothetical protein
VTFRFAITGSVIIDRIAPTDASAKAAIGRIAEMLREEKASTVSICDEVAHFTAAHLRSVIDSNILILFDSGDFYAEVDGDGLRIKYRLSVLRYFAIVAVMFSAWSAFIVWISFGLGWDFLVRAFLASTVAFGCIFGVPCLLAGSYRMHLWLRRGLSTLETADALNCRLE